jgi:adenine-specific DNA-methyltransferase
MARDVEKLVTEILALKEKTPHYDTQKLERKIDVMVYDLYKLTQDEIDIVESKN